MFTLSFFGLALLNPDESENAKDSAYLLIYFISYTLR